MNITQWEAMLLQDLTIRKKFKFLNFKNHELFVFLYHYAHEKKDYFWSL